MSQLNPKTLKLTDSRKVNAYSYKQAQQRCLRQTEDQWAILIPRKVPHVKRSTAMGIFYTHTQDLMSAPQPPWSSEEPHSRQRHRTHHLHV
jgi:hypothetical protein